MLSQSQRSRLQVVDSVEDEEEGNSINIEAVHPIEFEEDVVENLLNTTEDESLFTTDADVNISSENSHHNSQERTTEPSLPETTPTTTSPKISSIETTQTTTNSAVVIPTQDPRLTYDDSEWKPLFVNTPTNPDKFPQTDSITPDSSLDSEALLNHQPAHAEDDPDIYKIGLENHAEESPAEFDVAKEEGQKQTTDLPSNVQQDRVILNAADDDKKKDIASGEDETTSPVTPTKFSFLQWFNSQLNNVKLAQNHRQQQAANNSTNTELMSSGPSLSPTRFFTVKPTAVSYTGIQPIMRPKPWEENSTDSFPSDSPSMGPSSGTGFIVSTINRSAITDTAVMLPQSFHVQTSLSLAKEPIKLVESPRSQKSLPLLDNVHFRMSSGTTRNPRELQSERQQQVESLTDFFPPVRRPVARPQVSKSGLAQQRTDNLAGSLPIEGLFSTLKPPQGANQEIISKHRSNTNSPIYTFKLNQGQSVHDVLSQLLADLTIGESPSLVEVDGAAPSLTLAEQEQLQNNDMKNKASNKKVDDDRLKPWAHMPFRPAILNALYHNTRNPNTSSTNSINVNTTIIATSATPLLENEDASVTTSTEIATREPNSQHFVTGQPTEFTTTAAGKIKGGKKLRLSLGLLRVRRDRFLIEANISLVIVDILV